MDKDKPIISGICEMGIHHKCKYHLALIPPRNCECDCHKTETTDNHTYR